MRLKSIDISGFRGFASRQPFDLSADATVIVGVNGLGKTSLLDAILWGLCGRVERIGPDAKLVSLYSDTGEARVSVRLESGDGQAVEVARTCDGKSQTVQLSIGGTTFQGTSADAKLFELCWPDAASAGDGKAAFTSAFLRSVYLQQDRVRDFLEAASDQERFTIISELVGIGRLTELQVQLERERNSWSRATTQREKEGKPLEERVAELQRQLHKLVQSSAAADNGGSPSWDEWWHAAYALGVSRGESLPSAASVEASTALDVAIQQLQSLRASNQRRHNEAVSLRRLLDTKPPEPSASVDELREKCRKAQTEVADARRRLDVARRQAAENRRHHIESHELREQQQALAEIALRLLGERCPVCEQSYDYEATKHRLEEVIGPGREHASSVSEPSDIVGELAKLEEEAVRRAMEAQRSLDEVTAQVGGYRKWRAEVERSLLELELAVEPSIVEAVERVMATCSAQEELLTANQKAGERLSLDLAKESARSRTEMIRRDLDQAKADLAAHRVVIEARKVTGIRVERLLDGLRQAASHVSVDRLEEIEPFLQRVYARIDPHPAFRVVRLVTRFSRGRGRLDAEIHDSSEQLSTDAPSAVLSSSQLNALAVSLFLSLNLTLPRLPIDAALLDDPIQSLDDVNLLGLVDLLRRTKDRRQLIVSTHDIRFGKLLSRKLRPGRRGQRTSVIELSGWSRRGPKVRQYDVEAETMGLRFVGTE